MRPHIFAAFSVLISSLLIAAAHAEDSKPAAATLLDGRISYVVPAHWMAVKSSLPSDIAATYVAPDHDGVLLIEVLPEKAWIAPEAGPKLAAQFRASRKRAGQAIVLDPKLEKDPHFPIRIHEKYKNKQGAVADELHLYRKIGDRAVSVTVQSFSEDEHHIETIHKVGSNTLVSAKAKSEK